MEEGFHEQLVGLLDLLCISLFKIKDLAEFGEPLKANIATKEATKLVSSTSKFISAINKLPKPDANDITPELLKAHKTLEISSIVARKKILQVIAQTKKVILQSSPSIGDLLTCCKDTNNIFYSIYECIWRIQTASDVRSWSAQTRALLLRLTMILELSNDLNEEDNSLLLIREIIGDILKGIRDMQAENDFLDLFPVPVQAIIIECSSTLSEIISSDNSTYSEVKQGVSDLSVFISLLRETWSQVSFEELKNNEKESPDDFPISSAPTSPEIIEESPESKNKQKDDSEADLDSETTKKTVPELEITENIEQNEQKNESVDELDEKTKKPSLGPNRRVNMPKSGLNDSFGRQRSRGIAIPPQPALLRSISEQFSQNSPDPSASARSNTTVCVPSRGKERTGTFSVSSPRPETERKLGVFGVQRFTHEEEKKKREKQNESAKTITNLLFTELPELKKTWEEQEETQKEILLQKVYQAIRSVSFIDSLLDLPEEFTKSQELEHVIRIRSAADLTKVRSCFEQSFIEKPIAEHCLQVIVNSSLVVINPTEEEYETQLLQSSSQLFSALFETLKKFPSLDDSVRSFCDDLSTMILERSNNIKEVYITDEFIARAAKGHGNKMISYQMKINIWNGCNSLRILVAMLLSCLSSCKDSGQLNSTLMYQMFTCIRCIARVIDSLLGTVATAKHIITKVQPKYSDPQRSCSVVAQEINLWRETMADGKLIWEDEAANGCTKDIQTGTLNLLVLALTSDINLNQTFLKTFITTYRSFTTPYQLLSKLIERYDVPMELFNDAKRAGQIKLRVAVVVKYWLDTQFYDFDEDLIQSLQQFCERMNSDGLTDMAKRLQEHIISKETERNQRQESLVSIPPTDLTCLSPLRCVTRIFEEISVEELSKQLTLADYKIYQSIQAQELLNTAWNSDKLKHQSPHVTLMLGRLNNISNFICTLILWQTTKATRAAMLTKFMQLALHLRKLNNFHTLMGVVVALNRSSISRLRHTFAACDSKLINQFKLLESLMDPSGSFKNYRKAMQTTKLPALPYIGVSLTDLTFMEDGNPDTVQDVSGKTLINFTKRGMVYELIQKLLDYQNTPYSFPAFDPVQTLLTEFPFDEEKQQFRLSLFREPRGADPKSIV